MPIRKMLASKHRVIKKQKIQDLESEISKLILSNEQKNRDLIAE